MLFGDTKIESLILEILQGGSLEAPELILRIQDKRGKTTKQAVYTALRQLVKDEMVTKRGKLVSLNSLWLSQMWDFVSHARASFDKNSSVREPIMDLEEGDKVIYSFKNLDLTDQYWAHAFEILMTQQAEKEPIYIYNPHEWFLIARIHSEAQLLQRIDKERRLLLFSIKGDTKIDQYVARHWRSDAVKFNLGVNPLGIDDTTYINVFGDVILEVKIDQQSVEDIEHWYQSHGAVTPQSEAELQDIIQKRGRTRMKIYRNKKKAEKLKKLLGKDFHIPKEYRKM